MLDEIRHWLDLAAKGDAAAYDLAPEPKEVCLLLAVVEAAAELSENAAAGIPWPKVERLRAALDALLAGDAA